VCPSCSRSSSWYNPANNTLFYWIGLSLFCIIVKEVVVVPWLIHVLITQYSGILLQWILPIHESRTLRAHWAWSERLIWVINTLVAYVNLFSLCCQRSFAWFIYFKLMCCLSRTISTFPELINTLSLYHISLFNKFPNNWQSLKASNFFTGL